MILTLYDLWFEIIVMCLMVENVPFERSDCLQYYKVNIFFKQFKKYVLN
jgi:hypothetical protein